jgi:DNA-binding protein Fis
VPGEPVEPSLFTFFGGFMKARNANGMANKKAATASIVEDVIEQKLADITTLLHSSNGGKCRLHENILAMVEKSLFKIALQRSNNAKGAAAAYLGINRNTFQKKMVKLGIDNSPE